MSKIIPFPNSNKYRAANSAPTLDEIAENSANLKLHHIDETLEFLNNLIIDQMAIGGFVFEFDKNEGRYVKDLALISESLRALLYRYYGLDHHLHKLSDKLFTVSPKDKTIDWSGTFSIRVKKKKTEDEKSKDSK